MKNRSNEIRTNEIRIRREPSVPGISFTAIINNNQCQRPVVRLVDGSSSGEMHQLSKEVAQAAAAAPSPPSLTPPLPSLRLLPPLERSEASVASVF